MAKVTITKSELKDLFGGQDVVMSEENTVYIKPIDVKQKLGIPNDFDLEIVEDPEPEVIEEEDPNKPDAEDNLPL